MKTYTEKELVSFGTYLLSKERTDMFTDSEDYQLSKEERLKQVHHADVENWKEANRAIKFLSASLIFDKETMMFHVDIELTVDGNKVADKHDFCYRDICAYGKNYLQVLEDRIIKIATKLNMPETLHQQAIDEAFRNLTIKYKQ